MHSVHRRAVRWAAAVAPIALVVASCASGSSESGSAGTGPATDVAVTASAPSATDAPTSEPTEPATTEPATTEPATTESPSTEPPSTEPPSTGETSAGQPDDEGTPASYDFSALAPIVQQFVDGRGLNGAGLVVVQRDDGVIHEEYWGEFSADRISLVASSSKMITAGVLLRLQDDGLLDIDAPVADLVNWGQGNPDVTPAQLLSNSSGLVGLGPNPTYPPYLCQFIAAGALQECAATIFTTPDDDADVIAPDTEFRYGGAQWQVAGALAEVASGKPWSELIEEIYVEPCGLDALAFNNHFAQIPGGLEYPVDFAGDPATLIDNDNPNMEGGAYVTTGDYAELLLMHLRGGMCGENRVLSQESLDTMHGDRIAAAYDGDAARATGYGMGWWVDRETGRISDGGAYGSVPWLDLDDGYGAYLVIEDTAGVGAELAGLIEEEIHRAVTGG